MPTYCRGTAVRYFPPAKEDQEGSVQGLGARDTAPESCGTDREAETIEAGVISSGAYRSERANGDVTGNAGSVASETCKLNHCASQNWLFTVFISVQLQHITG